MRKLLSALVAVAFFAAIPAIAGEGHKCTAGTQECLDKMAAKMKKSGWIGVDMEYNKEKSLSVIKAVVPGSPAEEAGLKAGDVFYAMNGIEYTKANKKAIGAEWEKLSPGKKIRVTVKRGGETKDLKVKLGNMPADVLAKYIGQHMMEHATTEVAAK